MTRVRRVLSAIVVALALMGAMFGHAVMGAPQASADCYMTTQDQLYERLLASQNMIPGAGSNSDWCTEFSAARQRAVQVENSSFPLGTAIEQTKFLMSTANLSKEAAGAVVRDEIIAYAPEMVSIVGAEAQQHPEL